MPKDKFKIINLILSLICMCVILVCFAMTSRTHNETQKEIELLKIQMNAMDQNLFVIKGEIDKNQMQIADLWMRILGQDKIDKFETWETENAEFINCDKEFESMGVYRSYYTYDSFPASVLAYEFKTGSIVYELDGSVYCIKQPYEMKPEHVPCIELCTYYNNGTLQE